MNYYILFGQYQPEGFFFSSFEVKLHHNAGLRELINAHAAAHPPHQQYGIQFLRFGLVERPKARPN